MDEIKHKETGSTQEIDEALFKPDFEPIDTISAENVLREFKSIVDSIGVTFFLRQGTCLGAVRDQHIIPWDDDIDVGSVIGHHGLTDANLDHVIEKAIGVLTEHGFSTRVLDTDEFLCLVVVKSAVRIDWEFFRVQEGNIWHWPGQKFPVSLFATLKETDFLGEKFLIPGFPEEYLRLKYGAEWHIPKRPGVYEFDVIGTIPSTQAIRGIGRVIRFISRKMFRRSPTSILVLDENGNFAPEANVVVVGIEEVKVDNEGYAKIFLQNEFFYSIIVSFGLHKELLYAEFLSPGENYVYRRDPSSNVGRSNVLTLS